MNEVDQLWKLVKEQDRLLTLLHRESPTEATKLPHFAEYWGLHMNYNDLLNKYPERK